MVIEPGNNINSASSSANKARPGTTSRAAGISSPSGPKPGANSDNVSLSTTAQSLAKVEAELAKTPEVDETKVAQIKAAIASGRYQVDPDRIAEKMLNSDNSFL